MHTIRWATAAAITSLFTLAAGPALAQSANWDQERVTQIAEKLAEAVKDLSNTMRKAPDQPHGGPRRAQFSAREDVRLLTNTTQHLAVQLKGGAGQDETWQAYQRIQTLRRDAEENGRKAMISDQTMQKITPVRDLLTELAPYYAEE